MKYAVTTATSDGRQGIASTDTLVLWFIDDKHRLSAADSWTRHPGYHPVVVVTGLLYGQIMSIKQWTRLLSRTCNIEIYVSQ